MEKDKTKINNAIAGSEGSSGHVNVESVGQNTPSKESTEASEASSTVTPDDTLGSTDISGSGLPRGGTLSNEW